MRILRWFSSLLTAPLLAASALPALGQEAAPRSRGNAFNPDTSVNILTLYRHDSAGKFDDNGFSLQEAEIQFAADVDPYFRATALFSVAKEGKEWGIDPEEVYAETLSLPYVTLKAGRFKSTIGRHNALHSHAFPFIDAPLIHQYLLGDEGVREQGLSASAMIPAPWFSEFTLQVGAGESETLFASPSRNDLATVSHLKNLWELSDSTTLEWGLTGAYGNNVTQRATKLLGTDLTLKYRPVEQGKYTSFSWSTEVLWADRQGLDDSAATSLTGLRKLSGLSTWLQYQFVERWWFQERFDYAGFAPAAGLKAAHRASALVGYVLSEFSALRLQYDHLVNSDRSRDNTVQLQFNISIGAHPAHTY